MIAWRHASETDVEPPYGTVCDECLSTRIVPCTTPTPDPASPCGFKEGGPKDIPCGAVASHDWHDKRFWWQEPWLWHPHQPTRCTCGHPIEERA